MRVSGIHRRIRETARPEGSYKLKHLMLMVNFPTFFEGRQCSWHPVCFSINWIPLKQGGLFLKETICSASWGVMFSFIQICVGKKWRPSRHINVYTTSLRCDVSVGTVAMLMKLKVNGYTSVLFHQFCPKGDNLCEFQCLILGNKSLPKRCPFLKEREQMLTF